MARWSEYFPNGRCIYYEGDDPEAFVATIKAEFGFDPSQDPGWGTGLTHGPDDNQDFPDVFGRPYSFHCPPEHLDAIYGSDRFPMGS